MLSLTLMPVMIAPAGMVTGIELLIPASATAAGEAGGPITSGICMLSGVITAGKTAVVGGAVLVIDICWIVPAQMLADVGLVVATSGPTVSVALELKSVAVQGPEITTLY